MRAHLLIPGLFVAAVLSMPAPLPAVDAEPSDMEEASLAKTARARAKSSAQMRQQHGSGSLLGDQDAAAKGLSPCGINIGNSVNSQPGKAPKEIIVVVKGDVINANNSCR
jgi:hypothetical protein